jgi:hypothetical protein
MGRAMNESQLNSIKILTRSYYDYQRERTALDGRIGRKKNGEIKKGIPERDDEFLVQLMARREFIYTFETDLEKQVATIIHNTELWKVYLQEVKGCGEMMAAVIMSEFDIVKWENVSKGWSFAGLAPGKDRKEKGKKCPYNQFLRAKLCGVLGSSFLKCNSPYRSFYDDMKHRIRTSIWNTNTARETVCRKEGENHHSRASQED